MTNNPQKTTGHPRKVSKASSKVNSKQSDLYSKSLLTSYDSTERYPRSVLKLKSDKQTSKLHDTQKPYALLEWIIKTYTNEGDTVFDPCFGSNTTGVVCDDLKRVYYGCEEDVVSYNKGKK